MHLPASPRTRAFLGGLVVLGLVAAALAASWNSLGNPFLLDDGNTLLANPAIRGELAWWEHFTRGGSYSSEPAFGLMYRPVAALANALALRAWGLDRPRQRAMNLVLLGLLAGLAGGVAARLARDQGHPPGGAARAGVAAGLVVALHPLAAWAAQYLTARDLVLGQVLALAAFLLYRRVGTGRGGGGALAAAAGLHVLACWSKQNALALPLVLALDQALLQPARPAGRRVLGVALAASLGAYLVPVLLVGATGAAGAEVGAREAGRYAWTQLEVHVFHYLRWLVNPADIRWAAAPTGGARPLLGGAALAGLSALAWRGRESRPLLAFGWFAYLAALLPTSSLLPTAAPSIPYRVLPGLPWLAAGLAGTLVAPPAGPRRALVLLALGLALGTASRRVGWLHASALRLWEHACRRGALPPAHLLRATSARDPQEIEARLEALASRAPGTPQVHSSLGRARLWLRDHPGARVAFARAIAHEDRPRVRYWEALAAELAGAAPAAYAAEVLGETLAAGDPPREYHLVALARVWDQAGAAREAGLARRDLARLAAGPGEGGAR